MADGLRHARLLHYLLIGLSIGSIALMMQRSPLAESYATAQIELDILEVLLGRVPRGLTASELEVGTLRTQQARDLIATRVKEHVQGVLNRSLSMGIGIDFAKAEMSWDVPTKHQSQLPLDSDLLEIRSHFSAIPILVLQPDLSELAWLLTSRMSAEEIAQIRRLHIRLHDGTLLDNYISRSGFVSSEERVATELEVEYTSADGKRTLLQAPVHADAVRMPDLDQRAAFHVSFPELSRVFHFVEFQTPEQADLSLATRELEATGGPLRAFALSTGPRMSILLGIPLFMLLLLSHVRHLADLLGDTDQSALRSFPWFPLFLDQNSRSFGIVTLMLLPGAGAATWVAMHFIHPTAIPVEDLLLHAAGFAVPAWIGSSILSELEKLKNAAEELRDAGFADES